MLRLGLDYLRLFGSFVIDDDEEREEMEEGGDVFNFMLSLLIEGNIGSRRMIRFLLDFGYVVEIDDNVIEYVMWSVV